MTLAIDNSSRQLVAKLTIREPQYEALYDQWFSKKKIFLPLFKHGFLHKIIAPRVWDLTITLILNFTFECYSSEFICIMITISTNMWIFKLLVLKKFQIFLSLSFKRPRNNLNRRKSFAYQHWITFQPTTLITNQLRMLKCQNDIWVPSFLWSQKRRKSTNILLHIIFKKSNTCNITWTTRSHTLHVHLNPQKLKNSKTLAYK